MNTREFLLGIKPRVSTIGVEGQKINIREMSLSVRTTYESELMNYQNGKKSQLDVRSNILLQCVVDENGTRVFNDSDINVVKQMPSKLASDIFDKILAISGLDNEEIEEGKGE